MSCSRNLVVIPGLCLALLVFLVACDTPSGGNSSDGDAPDYPIDGDLETDDETEPCSVGESRCAPDNDLEVQACNDAGEWVAHHTCDEDKVCEGGKCVLPLPDGDDGDDTPEDGDYEWHCSVDLDCAYGFGCDPTGPDDGCVSRMECRTDADCAEGLICRAMSNWKACIPSQDACREMSDCQYGYTCVPGPDGWNICEDANECYHTVECEQDHMICTEGGQWRVCQPDGHPCEEDANCPFGYKCYKEFPQPVCIYQSNCSVDRDCPTLQRCVINANWKSCEFDLGATWCQNDDACPAGHYCDVLTCKSKNECSVDRDCAVGERCQVQDDYRQCIEQPPCGNDAECGFGYRCIPGSPNTCQYSNQCANDRDCEALQACKAVGNIAMCVLDTPSICTSDAGCRESEYCDTMLVIGECRSRNQCFIDADCGEGMVCQSNGHYNVCMPDSPKACWFDFQCPASWVCSGGKCRPIYEGTCSNIEGRWTVLIATGCTIIFTGQVYEFVPTDGCNGNIQFGDTQLPAGTFAETSPGKYDVRFTFQQCTGEVTLNALLNLSCGDCTVNLGQF